MWGTTSWPNETETTIKVESSYSPKLGVFLFSLSDGRRCRIRFVVFLSAALLDNIHVKRKKKLERKKRRETNDGENLTDRSERQREKERIMNRKKRIKRYRLTDRMIVRKFRARENGQGGRKRRMKSMEQNVTAVTRTRR